MLILNLNRVRMYIVTVYELNMIKYASLLFLLQYKINHKE